MKIDKITLLHNLKGNHSFITYGIHNPTATNFTNTKKKRRGNLVYNIFWNRYEKLCTMFNIFFLYQVFPITQHQPNGKRKKKVLRPLFDVVVVVDDALVVFIVVVAATSFLLVSGLG